MPRGIPKSGKRQPRGTAKKAAAQKTRAQKNGSTETIAREANDRLSKAATRSHVEADATTMQKFSLLSTSIKLLGSVNPDYLDVDVATMLRAEIREQIITLTELRRAVFGETTSEAVNNALAAQNVEDEGSSPTVGAPVAQQGNIAPFTPPTRNDQSGVVQ